MFMGLCGVLAGIAGNLSAGFRIALGQQVDVSAWSARVSSYLGIFVLVLVCLAFDEYSRLGGFVGDVNGIGTTIRFNRYGLVGNASLLAIAMLFAVLVCAMQSAYQRLPVFLTAAASLLFWYALVYICVGNYLRPALFLEGTGLQWLFPFFAVALGLAAVKASFQRALVRSYLLAGAGVLLVFFLSSSWYISTSLFYAPSPDYQRYANIDSESVYYRQHSLVENKLESVVQGDPKKSELFFVGFAGNGDEGVFRSEAAYAQAVVAKKYSGEDYALRLASNLDTLEDEPLANVYNLRAVLAGIAEKMNVGDDVLMLFLTSHGSRDGSIDVSLAPFEMQDLYATALAQMLDEVGIQWRIVIVSACFSGTFIDALRNANTLILTAASAEKTSFGCSSDRELTYFGEAFFGDALAAENDFIKAAEAARRSVSKREREEGLEPSQPELIVGSDILKKLESLGLITQ